MNKILIIEDEKILSQMYKNKFEKEGFEVFRAIDVEGGLDLAQKEIPDIVILDILLPRENGLVFLEKRREMESIKDIPVVIFSNFDDPESREKGMALGAKEYLIKSNHNPGNVVEIIKKHIK